MERLNIPQKMRIDDYLLSVKQSDKTFLWEIGCRRAWLWSLMIPTRWRLLLGANKVHTLYDFENNPKSHFVGYIEPHPTTIMGHVRMIVRMWSIGF